MLPKKARISKELFRDLLKKSRAFHSEHFVLRVSPLPSSRGQNTTVSRFAFVVSGKVSKKAPTRNTLKRRGRAVVKKYVKNISSGYAFIFLFKKDSEELSFQDIENEVLELLRKSKKITD